MFQAVTATHVLSHRAQSYTVKKVIDFPVLSRDVTYQTPNGRENSLIIAGHGEFG
jgi:hypothetical protein